MPNQFYSEFPEQQAAGTLKTWPKSMVPDQESVQSWKATKAGFRTSTGKSYRDSTTYSPTDYKCSTQKGDAYPYGIGDKPTDWRVSSRKKQPSDEHYGNEPFNAKGLVTQASQEPRKNGDSGWGKGRAKNPSAPNKGAKRAPGRKGSATPPAVGGGYT